MWQQNMRDVNMHEARWKYGCWNINNVWESEHVQFYDFASMHFHSAKWYYDKCTKTLKVKILSLPVVDKYTNIVIITVGTMAV